MEGFNSAFRIPHSAFSCSSRRGQASLEMTVALFGALLLLFGCLKLCLWFNERCFKRNQDYDHTRARAGSDEPQAPYEPKEKLDFFR